MSNDNEELTDSCTWQETESNFESNFETSCGHSFIFFYGGPKEDLNIKFCIYCGELIHFDFEAESEE